MVISEPKSYLQIKELSADWRNCEDLRSIPSSDGRIILRLRRCLICRSENYLQIEKLSGGQKSMCRSKFDLLDWRSIPRTIARPKGGGLGGKGKSLKFFYTWGETLKKKCFLVQFYLLFSKRVYHHPQYPWVLRHWFHCKLKNYLRIEELFADQRIICRLRLNNYLQIKV